MWLDDVAADAHAALLKGGSAVAYLRERGVSDQQMIRYRLGHWDSPPAVANCSQEFWEWSRRYGYNRIVFPMTDGLGGTVGLQVRHLGDKGYENFVLKPRELYLGVFGLAQALPTVFATGRIVLVEGPFDLLAIEPHAPDVVATLTANVSLNVRRLLSRYATLCICLFDMDAAGRRGAYRLAGLEVPQEFRQKEDVARQKPRVPPCSVLLPSYSEHDPDDLRKAGKLPELQRLLMAEPVISSFAQL